MCFALFSAAAFFLVGPWTLFIKSTTWKKCKFNFKSRSHSTIHIFKIYFATVFSVISIRAPAADVLNVPNVKFLAHLAHQTQK